MDLKIEKLPQARTECKVTIPEDRRLVAEKQALERLSQKMKLKGFRPGKAPPEVVKEQVSTDDLLKETVHALLPEILKQAIEQEKLAPLLPPKVTIVSPAPLTLSLLFIERPPVKIKGKEKLKLPKSEAKKVTKQDIDAFVAQMFEGDRIETPLERAIEKGDLVRLELSTTDAEGKPVEVLSSPRFQLTIGSEQPVPLLSEQLLGLKKGENKSYETVLSPQFEVEELKGKKIKVQAKVHGVAQVSMPPLTDEFLKERLKMDTTAEKFLADIEKMLTEREAMNLQRSREQQFFDSVQAATIVDLAPELIEAELNEIVQSLQQRLKKQNMSLEDWLKSIDKDAKQAVDEMRKVATDRLKLRFGLRELIIEENIEIPDAEMQAAIDSFMKQQQTSDATLDRSAFKPGNDAYEQFKWEQQVAKVMKKYME